MAAGPRVKPTREDTWKITLTVNGDEFGVWDKKTGGDVDSDEVKYYPGNMLPPISLGGRRTVANVILQREYDLDDDHVKINTLLNLVGSGKVEVVQQPLDVDGLPKTYKGITYLGTLKRVLIPPVDSEATGASLIEVEITVDGYPTSG